MDVCRSQVYCLAVKELTSSPPARYTTYMLDHYIQRNIVYSLALAPGYRFSELQPDGLENKLFDYHLKKVIAAGYVEKNEDGTYSLTPTGRRMGKDVLKREQHLIDRAYSVLFLAVRRSEDGAWLLCRRKTHPMFDQIGFLYAQPELSQHVAETAAQELLAKTGLQGSCTVRGNGYFRMYKGDDLESFTHFTVLECDAPTGELQQLDQLAEYFWASSSEIDGTDVLPSVKPILEKLVEPGQFYLEEDFHSEA